MAIGPRVAVFGCGNMGSAMARRIAGQGFQLCLYNRTPDRARAMALELGGEFAATPAAAAAGADVLLTMVSDDTALNELCHGADGLLAGASPGSVTVQTSTVLPETVRALAQEFAKRELLFLDSPVSGSVTSATAGELALLVAGSAAAVERARPVLEVLSRRIFEMGAVGNGAAMKLAVNDVVFALNVALSEALVLAEAAGVDRSLAYDAFAGSAIGAPFLQYKRGAFVEPQSLPPAFTFDLVEKDFSLILDLARRTGTPMAQAEANLAALRSASAALGGDRDFSELAVFIRGQRSEQAIN
jgi:3-hydroxyisobutyrate dehydrogenase-like beta-hydroxyacid dehydrogenase